MTLTGEFLERYILSAKVSARTSMTSASLDRRDMFWKQYPHWTN
jgi:hypothetical protein